mgnify:CR=1 FL=1
MERTCELIKQAKEGNKEAQSILVEENSGLIWSVVKRFQGRGYDKEDLFQIGSIGLLKCIENFDLERNVKFSTYAVPLIMGEIKRFLRDDGIVKVSRSLKEASYKIKREKEHYQKLYNREPTLKEIAVTLDMDESDILMAMEYLPAGFGVKEMRAEYKNQAVLDSVIVPKVHEQEGVYTVVLDSPAGETFAVVELR